jgi:hypothetical protein
MADPYAGIFIDQGGGEDETPWFFDFGLGPWGGAAAWLGGALAVNRLNSPKATTSILSHLRKATTATYGPGAWTPQWPKSFYGGIPGPQGNYQRLRKDIMELAGGKMGRRNLNFRLFDRARRTGVGVVARYGGGLTGAGTRIAVGGIAQMAMTTLEIVGGLYFGAQMTSGLASAIADWEPAPSRGPELEFGNENFQMPRAAMTQRMRALQSIHNSQLTTRAALGNEAPFLHN